MPVLTMWHFVIGKLRETVRNVIYNAALVICKGLRIILFARPKHPLVNLPK